MSPIILNEYNAGCERDTQFLLRVRKPRRIKCRLDQMLPYHKTKHGLVILGNSLDYMAGLKSESIDLIVTSPPFGLVRKKDYGNVESRE